MFIQDLVPSHAEARNRLGMSQSELAALMGVSPRTLQDWEQGRSKATGAAQTVLRVAIAHPEALRIARVVSVRRNNDCALHVLLKPVQMLSALSQDAVLFQVAKEVEEATMQMMDEAK